MQRRSATRDEVQMVISSLLGTSKEALTIGVAIAKLDNDYRSEVGSRIPFRELGYSCLLDYLETLKGTCTIRYRNGMYYVYKVVDEKTAHLSALVAGQNSKRNVSNKRRTYRPSPCYPRVIPQPMRMDNRILAEIVDIIERAPNGKKMEDILYYARNRSNCAVDQYDLSRQLREVGHKIQIEGNMVYPIAVNPESGQIQRSNGPSSTVDLKPAGYSDDEEEDNYENYYPAEQVSHAGKPVAEKKQENSNSSKRMDVEMDTQGNDYSKNMDSDGWDISMLVNERTRIRLAKLIQGHPDGIWCADLPELYQKEYTISLNYEELGFGSVSDFAAHLPDIFHCVRPQETGDFKLYDAKVDLPNIRGSQRPKAETLSSLHNIYEQHVELEGPIPTVLSQLTLERLIPDGVMTIGETVAHISVTELDRGITQYIDVLVVDALSPSLFWIQLVQRIPRFMRLMSELHAFYDIHAREYVMPIALMEKGMNCACKYDEKWHRALIQSVRPDNLITVMFYDYGTVQSYPAECIHFLHRSFANLPSQAIPCALHNVRPVEGNRWSRTVSIEFVAKATSFPMLAANIASVDTNNNSMMVGLTSTQEEEDFHINDWLVESKMAIYGRTVCIKPSNYQRFMECTNDSTPDTCKYTSLSEMKSVNLGTEKNVKASSSDVTTCDDVFQFYNMLVKLHRSSKFGKNPSEFFLKERCLVGKSGNEDIFNDVQSQTGKYREPDVVRRDLETNTDDMRETTGVTSAYSRGKIIETRFYDEFSDSSDRDIFGSSSTSDDSKLLDERRDETYVISGGSTISSSICSRLCDNNGVFRYETNENDETNENGVLAKQCIPLLLKPAEKKDKYEEFGEFRSTFGGCGRMEPIDWSIIRKAEKNDDAITFSKASTLLSNIRKKLENDFPDFTRKEDLLSMIREDKIDVTSRFDEEIDKCNVGKITEAIIDEESKDDSPTMPKLWKKKRTLLNLIKSKTTKVVEKNLENNDLANKSTIHRGDVVEKNRDNTFTTPSKFERKTFTESIEGEDYFGTFHSSCGGSGRLEPVIWSEIRELINSPDKTIEVTPPALESDSSRGISIPTNLPKANGSFLKIINNLSRTSSEDRIMLPEDNIKSGGAVTPLIRMLIRRTKIDPHEKLNIVISNEIFDYIKSNVDNNLTSGSEEKDSPLPRKVKSAKNDSESLSETSLSTNSQKDSTKNFFPYEQLDSKESIEMDSRIMSESSENSLNLPDEILPFPVIETSSTIMGKSSSPIDKKIYENSRKPQEDNPSPLNIEVTFAPTQSVDAQQNKRQFAKLLEKLSDSSNDSQLDSDDLSCSEQIKSDQEQDHSMSKIDEIHDMVEMSRKQSFLYNKAETSETQISNSEKNQENSVISCVNDSFDYPKVFNDLEVESDGEEWDYSPGFKLSAQIKEIQKDSRKERKSSDDESSLDISDNVQTETKNSDSSRQETDDDRTPNENQYIPIEDQSDIDLTRNSNNLGQDSTNDNSEIFESPNYTTADEERLIDPDESDEKTYSILSEIKKSNILRFVNPLINSKNSSSSSDEKSDFSYKSSIISTIKSFF